MSEKVSEEKSPMTSPTNNERVRVTEMIRKDKKSKTLFSKIQTAKAETGDNSIDFIKAIILIIVGSMAKIAALFVTNAVPIAMIIIGCVYINECRVRPGIPFILVISGGIIIVQSILESVKKYKLNSNQENQSEIKRKFQWISIGFAVASVACFIATCVLVYGSRWPKFDSHRSDNYCNPTLFLFSYWMLNIAFIFFAYVLAIALLATVYACLIS